MGDAAVYDLAAVVAERDALKAEVEQLRVQLAGCGVAALCNTEESRAQQTVTQGAYGWSDSYDQVLKAVGRELALRAEVAKLRDDAALHDETLEICNKQFASLRAEVERLSAACAAKDAALRSARELLHSSEWPSLCNNIDTALSDTAGTGWIDATGAVEATAHCAEWGADVEVYATVPDDWAGSKVKIVRVRK